MRHVRGMFALAVAAGVIGVAIPAAAAAHEFTGSTSEEVRVTGVGAQEFTFKPFKITCEKAKSVKTGNDVAWPSPTLYVEVKYSGCEAKDATFHKVELPPVKTTFSTPVDYEYHANGFVESGANSESTSEIKNAGYVEINLKGEFKCDITWEPQTIPSKALKRPAEEYGAAIYEKFEEKTENLKSFPLGVQDKLLIKNDLTKMTFEVEEGICELFETTEGKSGSYVGTLQAGLKKGNLGWE
jgi:hypothetical protein